MGYVIERRVANTKTWNVIDHAETREEALEKARRGDRKNYAGVRITSDASAYEQPEVVIGN